MKTDWDYSTLAKAYLKRADYSDTAIDAMLAVSGLKAGANVCDVGAGVAHLTLMLAKRNVNVIAVEPNDAMREEGTIRTKNISSVSWYEGTAEKTFQTANQFDMVTFGSSFNVCDRTKALIEAKRICKPRGWFACMWNHRVLTDHVQSKIEATIKNNINNYSLGTRREDQTKFLRDSGYLSEIIQLVSVVEFEQTKTDCIEAWRSHATLERQSGDNFQKIISEIESVLSDIEGPTITVPYETKVWVGRFD